MFQLQNIRKFLFLCILIAVSLLSEAQFVSKVLNYLPAPGQYTNAEFIGTPDAANSLVGTNRGLVSLGAYGGSVTVYFSQGIQNDPGNPYGVDFSVYGNATGTWSEPGIIQVMKDENKNGIPDETWYEIGGSDHFWDSTLSLYEVTYQNNGLSKAGNIQWTDNFGASGIIPENTFHQQPYYPKTDLYPKVAADKYSLKGSRLAGQIDLSNPGVVDSHRRAFGYADNTPVLSATEKLPDNPYTIAIEGSGGDAIDIGWAIDAQKKPVMLDEIHFIRIYTGMNALAGWLGEISTEITGIRDVEPASPNGVRSMVVIQDVPRKVMVDKSVNLNAVFFESGLRKENALITWSITNSDLASIEGGKLTAKKAGILKLQASSSTNPDIFAEKEIEIFSVGKAQITISTKSIKVNDRLELTGKLTDQNGNILTGITPSWRVGNNFTAEILTLDGKYFLKGEQIGKSWLYLEVPEMKSIRDSVLIEIFQESVLKKVFISVKTNEKTIIPRQSVWVEQLDLTPKVDRAQKSYGLQDINFVSLAHAVAAAFKSTGLSTGWAFRDDAEGGSALYLWKVPEMDEGSTIYHFGYGGSRTSEAFRKTWVVMHNQQPLISGFDQVKLNNNDEILIYHITDNNLPWTVTHLTSATDTIKTNQSIEIQLKKYFCQMGNTRNVSVNSAEVIASQAIRIEPKNLANQSITLITDEFGKASFSPDKLGEYLLTSGIDVSKLIVESITSSLVSLKKQLNCAVTPNPFSDIIHIDSPVPMESIEIYNAEGKLVYWNKDLTSDVDLSNLNSGVYTLRCICGNQILQQKIVKTIIR